MTNTLSTPDKYCHPTDCHIERVDTERMGPRARLLDSDGDTVWEFPANWTDEQIMIALAFANHAHGRGVALGMDRKAREVRNVLGINH